MNIVELGDSLHLLDKVEESSVQTIYFDPPFNTQKIWIMAPDDETGFSDIWESNQTYIDFIEPIVLKCKKKLTKNSMLYLFL